MNTNFVKYNGSGLPVPPSTIVTVVDTEGKFTIAKAIDLIWTSKMMFNDTYRHVYAYCVGIFISDTDTLH